MNDGRDPATAVFDPGGDCCVVMYVMRTAARTRAFVVDGRAMHMGVLLTSSRRRFGPAPHAPIVIDVMGFDAMQRNAMQCGQILRWRLSGRWCVYHWIDSNVLVLNFLVVQC